MLSVKKRKKSIRRDFSDYIHHISNIFIYIFYLINFNNWGF